MTSNITPGHVRAFQAVTSGIYGEVSLWSCTINGEPGVALVLVEHAGEGRIGIMPLFVGITASMTVAFDDEAASSGGTGRRPHGPARCLCGIGGWHDYADTGLKRATLRIDVHANFVPSAV